MKKLMIAAAVTAMTAGAFAADCAETVDCPYGYQIKVMVKTTTAATVQGVKEEECDESANCVRVPATKRFAGFIYGSTEKGEELCGEGACGCNDWSGAKLILWNYDTKALAQPEAAGITQFDRIFAGDTTTVELAFQFDNLVFAGFGKVAKRNGSWTLWNASGFCAGQIKADSCKASECAEEESAACWLICADEKTAPTETPETTVAYGKWTIDWSATVYNRYAAGQSLQPSASWGWGEDGANPEIDFASAQ